MARDVASAKAVVFEGARGALLDEWVGHRTRTSARVTIEGRGPTTEQVRFAGGSVW
jgi:hypothetical protein